MCLVVISLYLLKRVLFLCLFIGYIIEGFRVKEGGKSPPYNEGKFFRLMEVPL